MEAAPFGKELWSTRSYRIGPTGAALFSTFNYRRGIFALLGVPFEFETHPLFLLTTNCIKWVSLPPGVLLLSTSMNSSRRNSLGSFFVSPRHSGYPQRSRQPHLMPLPK